jgi:hypothetical protein
MQTEIRENAAIKESWSVIHPLSPEDSLAMTALRSAVVAMKGMLEGVAGPRSVQRHHGARRRPNAVTFEADIRDVQHCRTREGSVRLVLLGAKARNRGNHRRVRPPQTGSRQASVVRAKHPRPVKFELLESLARTAAALSNAKASLRVKSKVAAPNEVVEFRAGAFLWEQSHKMAVKSGTCK